MDVLKSKYNIIPKTIHPLEGDINYSNKKYFISDKDDNKYILKIYIDPEELSLAKEECRILQDISAALPFQVPSSIPNNEGDYFTGTSEGVCRLLNYIDGDFLANVPQTDELLFNFGEKTAQLHRALSGLESDILSGRKIFWDLQYSQYSYDKDQYIPQASDRKLIRYFFDRYHNNILPVLHKLRKSLIHGDLNDYNVLVKGGKINGFIDFGDSTQSPLINELAIAITYIMLGKVNPVKDMLSFIKGFHKEIPLEKDELEILPDLITTRLCVSLCNAAEKRAKSLASEYVLVSEKPAWDLLKNWLKINPLGIRRDLLSAVDLVSTRPETNQENALKRRDEFFGKSLSMSYSKPVYLESALFQYMYDKHGNTYLDAYNNIPHVGHSHPSVYRAISRQANLLNTNTRYLYDSLLTYTEKLLSFFPAKLSKVFFVNSGSAASDLAIRLARNYTSRDHLLVMDHGYHGNTATGISISPYKFDGKGGKGLPDGVSRLPLPNMYNGQFSSGSEYVSDAKNQINSLLDRDIIPAAFIAEPISGCGGQVPLAENYLREIYTFLENKATVMISDEVQVGFGRLGDYFWGYEMHGVVPDMVILGKPMANGHPMGAVICTEEIADAFDNGMEFFSSFGGNPVSCEAGRAVLEVLEEEELQQNAKTVGSYYLECASYLKDSYDVIGDVRGAGLFIGIEFTKADGSPATSLANKIKNSLKEEFILTGTDGPFDNVLKSKPPLCFSRENVDQTIDSIDGFLKKTL